MFAVRCSRWKGIHQVTVRLSDHFAAEEIEAAVSDGRPYADAFPGEGAGSLTGLRLTLLRKGFSRPPGALLAGAVRTCVNPMGHNRLEPRLPETTVRCAAAIEHEAHDE
jgi:hypothetical protein